MMEVALELENEHATRAAAAALAPWLAPDTYVALIGQMGAGKTTFVRALAEALGATTAAASPTFTLLRVHELAQPNSRGMRTLYHYDWYRLRSAAELLDIGFGELPPAACALVEWADLFPDELTPLAWTIRLSSDAAEPCKRHLQLRAPRDVVDSVSRAIAP